MNGLAITVVPTTQRAPAMSVVPNLTAAQAAARCDALEWCAGFMLSHTSRDDPSRCALYRTGASGNGAMDGDSWWASEDDHYTYFCNVKRDATCKSKSQGTPRLPVNPGWHQ
jgi:hypothetical protein